MCYRKTTPLHKGWPQRDGVALMKTSCQTLMRSVGDDRWYHDNDNILAHTVGVAREETDVSLMHRISFSILRVRAHHRSITLKATATHHTDGSPAVLPWTILHNNVPGTVLAQKTKQSESTLSTVIDTRHETSRQWKRSSCGPSNLPTNTGSYVLYCAVLAVLLLKCLCGLRWVNSPHFGDMSATQEDSLAACK